MADAILVSVCIPAYKRSDFLKRLLDSILVQAFRNFEVIVTDDSPDDSVKSLCQQYRTHFSLNYYRNPVSLGTPANWNQAISKAKGQWIKLMHDDDWFSDESSLQQFADAIARNPSASFIFSAYKNVYLDTGHTKNVLLNAFRFRMLCKNPVTLFSSNVIGPPSVVIYRNDRAIEYDSRLKWVVDIDFYIRYLSVSQPVYIGKILLNIGIGQQQVSFDCFRQRPVEIPENFYLLNKVGENNLRNILVYDGWWRLMRNLEIKEEKDIIDSGYSDKIPRVISSMIGWQKRIPRSFLQTGFLSKFCMMLHYICNYSKIGK